VLENHCVVVTEEGSYLRLIDFCITQLTAQGPSRTCNESKEEEEDLPTSPSSPPCSPQLSASPWLSAVEGLWFEVWGFRVFATALAATFSQSMVVCGVGVGG